MNSILSITSFADSSDAKAAACLTAFANECVSGVEAGVHVSVREHVCVQKQA